MGRPRLGPPRIRATSVILLRRIDDSLTGKSNPPRRNGRQMIEFMRPLDLAIFAKARAKHWRKVLFQCSARQLGPDGTGWAGLPGCV